MSLLEVKDLHTEIQLRTRVVKAVDGVSFNIEAGETVGLVGESGCGKSMTASTIMRLLPPGGRVASGSISLSGKELTAMSDHDIRSVRGNDIGMVFQDPLTSLNPTMNIGRQIAESVVLHKGVSKQQGLARAAEVLGLVGMPNPVERLRDYPHQLSGGLRQRVMIAMALSCEPKLLIADEPTTALDVTIQAQILALIDDLKERLGMAVLLITHDMGVIAGHADRTMVMYAGKIVESATTDRLFEDVHHPYTEALLASIPQLDQDKTQRLYAIPGLPPDFSRALRACRFAPRCRYATEVCRAEEPPLGGDDLGHPYACFHPVSRTVEELAGAGDLLGEGAEAAPLVEVGVVSVVVPRVSGAKGGARASTTAEASQYPHLPSSGRRWAGRAGGQDSQSSSGPELSGAVGRSPRTGDGSRGGRPGHPRTKGSAQGVPGHRWRSTAAQDRGRAGREGRGPRPPRGGDGGHSGGVRLRQVDPREADRRPRAPDLRRRAFRRDRPDEAKRSGHAQAAPRLAAHVPGPVLVARPPYAGRDDHP